MKLLLFLLLLAALPADCKMRRMGRQRSNAAFNPNPAAARSGQKIMKMFGSAVGAIMEQKQQQPGIGVRDLLTWLFLVGLVLLGAYSIVKSIRGLQSKHDTFVPCKHVKIGEDSKFFLQHGIYPDQIGNRRRNKLKNM